MFQDGTGHLDLIGYGYDPHYVHGPNPLVNQEARRAVYLKAQTYPANSVNGMGTLVCGSPNGYPGEMFSVLQPPPVVQRNIPVPSDIYGGGTLHTNIGTQSLLDNGS